MPPRWVWTQQRESAARLAAEGKRTKEIAEACGATRGQVKYWKDRPEFRARVVEHVAAWQAETFSRGIADRERRLEALHRRWQLLWQILVERAADPAMAEVPGGKTGLLVRRVRLMRVLQQVEEGELRAGGYAEVVEYHLDTELLRELREIEKQAALESGQSLERPENATKLVVQVSYAEGDADPSAPPSGAAEGGS